MILFVPGAIIGPPQLNEYPVDPVGVETISPSAQYVFKNSSSTYASILIIDDVSFFKTATSFKAKFLFLNRLFVVFKERSVLLLVL